MKQFEATVVHTDRYFLGECARYDEVRGELYWVNVAPDGGQFFRAAADGPSVSILAHYDLPGSLTAVVPFANRSEGWLVACDDSILHLREDGSTTVVASPEAHNQGAVRTNDGAADPWGRFYIGSMARNAATGRGSLYRFHENTGVETILIGLTIANGIGWSPDERTMYYVDSGPGLLWAFDVTAEGTPEHQRVFASFDVPNEGTPDGLCVDVDGHVWVALWGGYEVRRYAPDGTHVASVSVDTAQPSCCTIGGATGTTLYITTAQEDMSEAQLVAEPNAGRLFAAEVGVRGLPINPYRPTLRGSL